MLKIFIHIPKNGGMTVRRHPIISQKIITGIPRHHINPEYTHKLHRKMEQTQDHPGDEHVPWRFLKTGLKENFTSFAIVRNPWDRVVSRYFFAKKVIEVEKKVPKSYANVSSFEAFLEERHKWGQEEFMWHRAVRGWYPAKFHVTDEEGNLKCDILRFEDMDNELQKYFNIVDTIPHRNVTALNKKTYQSIYTPKTIQIVADWYKDDIDFWGFDFNSPATRNTYYEKIY